MSRRIPTRRTVAAAVATMLTLLSLTSLGLVTAPAQAAVGESVTGSGTVYNIGDPDGPLFCSTATFDLDAHGATGTQGTGTWGFRCPDGRSASGTIDCFALQIITNGSYYAASARMLGTVT